MKLLFISKYAATPETDNPSRQYFFAKELANRGHRVMLVNSVSNGVNFGGEKGERGKGGKGKDGRKVEKSKGRKVGDLDVWTLNGPVIQLGMNFRRIWSWVWFEVQLLRNYGRFRAFGPDVVLVSSLSFLSFWNGMRLKRKLKVPLAIEIRDLYPLTLMEVGGMSRWHPVVLFMAWLEKRVYKEADVIVSSLENAIEHVQSCVGTACFLSGLIANRFLWLPMGYEGGMFEVKKSPIKIGASDGRKVERTGIIANEIKELKKRGFFVVGYAGTLGAANAMDGLLELTRDVEIMEAQIAFVFIGPGRMAEAYRKEYEDEHVRFFSAIPMKTVPTVLSECHLLYNAWLKRDIYRFGISPNKWIEYMLAGRPILLAHSARSTIFDEAGCGWQIEAENQQDLKLSLLGIRGLCPQELDKKGLSGRQYLEKHLSYSWLAAKLEQKLEEAIHGA